MFSKLVWASLTTALLVQPLSAGVIPASSVLRRQATSSTFKSTGNPILADGTVYSADPAPIVVNDTLYILSGRDEAGPTTNSFVMNEWQISEAKNPDPAGAEWTLHRDVAQPSSIFAWAADGFAYASQIVQGPDGKFYLYAPVQQKSSSAADPFAIGVAVSDGLCKAIMRTVALLNYVKADLYFTTLKSVVSAVSGFRPYIM